MAASDLVLIRNEVQRRGISRVCHLTQSRKLPHILKHLDGIYSVDWLKQNAPDLFDANDKQRMDGLPDHISCSVEYPNVWYLKNATAREELFKEWVVLLIKPEVLWREHNRFCIRNCGAMRGNLVKEGYTGFVEMFQNEVSGAGGRVFPRTTQMLTCCPTDGQAEAMIHRQIPRDMIFGIAIPDKKRAEDEIW